MTVESLLPILQKRFLALLEKADPACAFSRQSFTLTGEDGHLNLASLENGKIKICGSQDMIGKDWQAAYCFGTEEKGQITWKLFFIITHYGEDFDDIPDNERIIIEQYKDKLGRQRLCKMSFADFLDDNAFASLVKSISIYTLSGEAV